MRLSYILLYNGDLNLIFFLFLSYFRPHKSKMIFRKFLYRKVLILRDFQANLYKFIRICVIWIMLCFFNSWYLESLNQDACKQAILERLRRGLVCLSYHVLTKPAHICGFLEFHSRSHSFTVSWICHIIHSTLGVIWIFLFYG